LADFLRGERQAYLYPYVRNEQRDARTIRPPDFCMSDKSKAFSKYEGSRRKSKMQSK
jgi:hypothetical protein